MRWGWAVSGERRWERALREMDLGELATNFPMSLFAAEASPALMERVERKRWPCFVRAHWIEDDAAADGGWSWWWFHG